MFTESLLPDLDFYHCCYTHTHPTQSQQMAYTPQFLFSCSLGNLGMYTQSERLIILDSSVVSKISILLLLYFLETGDFTEAKTAHSHKNLIGI